MTDLSQLTTLQKRHIADEIMREELEAAVNSLSELALESGLKLDPRGMGEVDRKMWDEIKHTRASLAIEFVNAWKLCYDSFDPDDC